MLQFECVKGGFLEQVGMDGYRGVILRHPSNTLFQGTLTDICGSGRIVVQSVGMTAGDR